MDPAALVDTVRRQRIDVLDTGRLTLWVSEATAASHAAALDAWSRLAPAGLDRTLLPGDHYSLLRRPEVERLARELTAQLVRDNDDGSAFAAGEKSLAQVGERGVGEEPP